MIVQYNKVTPNHRSLVRSIESKAYVGYIRYLLLKRWPFERIKKELMRLGLAWNDKGDFEVYFSEVLYPVITKHKLTKYYRVYKKTFHDETLSVNHTFSTNEMERIAFIDLLKKLEVEQFFAEEIVNFYGGIGAIPTHPDTGEPLIEQEKPVDLVEVLQNPKRHVIEKSLIEGYSPKQIADHLFQMYDMEITPQEIKVYAKSFFNVKRQDIQRLIDSLQQEKDDLQNRLTEIRHRPPDDFSFGERFEVLAVMNNKVSELSGMIKKLSGVHTSTAYNAAVLEMTDIREMFKDVLARTHRRFREMDERTEDAVISPLGGIVNMMSKATEKIISIEDIMSQKTSKTINEEIFEAVIPTLDRIEQEEREAMYSYKKANGEDEEDDVDDTEILGFD